MLFSYFTDGRALKIAISLYFLASNRVIYSGTTALSGVGQWRSVDDVKIDGIIA